MSAKITPDHLGRTAVVYVRQSTMSQVMGNLESQRRQYDLAGAAQNAGFVTVTVIDEDLGRSGSASAHRPGFERLVAMVCSGNVGAVYCENAHMKKNCARKSARGGRALLTGLMRCERCGRMMRVFYGQAKGHAHRYQCRGDDAHVGAGMCIGIGGLRIDRAVASPILEAVSDRAVEAALSRPIRWIDHARRLLRRSSCDRIVAPLVLDGAIDGTAFHAWVEQFLTPTLRVGDIVVAYNLSSHKVVGVREAIEARGARIMFLPAYSPDLNPIEQLFAKLKAVVRRIAPRSRDALFDALAHGLDQVDPDECANYLDGCGQSARKRSKGVALVMLGVRVKGLGRREQTDLAMGPALVAGRIGMWCIECRSAAVVL